MAGKTLQIIFNGISTLWPGPPRNGGKPVDKAFVMMAASHGTQVNQWGATIAEHFPFVRVARSVLVDPPNPAEATQSARGEHFIYYFKDARVVIHPGLPAGTRGIKYFIDPDGHPLAERPGSDNVAKRSDIRWLADIRDILPVKAPLKGTANPAKKVGPEVAAIVELEGGEMRANFPCASVSPKTFRDAKTEKVVLRRVLADEFIIDIPYPEATDQITLEFKDLTKRKKDENQLKKLVLRWPQEEELLVVRMGNDTKQEVRRLDTPERCDPVRRAGPVLKRRDDDFDLHYNFLDIPEEVGRPLPQNDIQQCDFDGCKPAIAGGGE